MQLGMEMRVVLCTFARVNFVAESAPESRNLHLKFQNLSGSEPPGPNPHYGR